MSYRKVYQTLVSTARTSSGPSETAIQDTPPLDREDYPDVKYWRKLEATNAKRKRGEFDTDKPAQKGRPPKAEAKNVAFRFLQDEDGNELPYEDLEQIRADAKVIWSDLCDANGPIGGPWRKVSPRHQLQFYLRIEAKHSILRLCDNHYKAESIATCDYTHWYGPWLAHYEAKKVEEARKKAEAWKLAEEAPKITRSQKRTHSVSPIRARKAKRQTESDEESDESGEQWGEHHYEDKSDANDDDHDPDPGMDGDMHPSRQSHTPLRRSPRKRPHESSSSRSPFHQSPRRRTHVSSPMPRSARATPASTSSRPKPRPLQSKGKAPERRRASVTRRSATLEDTPPTPAGRTTGASGSGNKSASTARTHFVYPYHAANKDQRHPVQPKSTVRFFNTHISILMSPPSANVTRTSPPTSASEIDNRGADSRVDGGA